MGQISEKNVNETHPSKIPKSTVNGQSNYGFDTDFTDIHGQINKKQLPNSASNSIPLKLKICYGVGHVFNDLCASMWFSYLVIFFEQILNFSSTLAGLILLVGQLADGFATPIVGIFSDKKNNIPICARYGRRKVWHLIGTICVTVSFPFIFSSPYGLDESASDVTKSIYYSAFVVVFQFGWASVQISHLALIPDLASGKHQRTQLNSIRYAFTVLANLSVYGLTYFILELGASPDNGGNTFNNTSRNPYERIAFFEENAMETTGFPEVTEGGENIWNTTDVCEDSGDSLGPDDVNKFRIIASSCVVTGLVFSIIFHLGVKEPNFVCKKDDTSGRRHMKKLDWFKQPSLYVVATLYVATRLYVNLYQVYMPLFVQVTLCLAKTAIATVPFTMYLAGFVVSFIMERVNKHIGRKRTYTLGCLLGIAGCIYVYVDGYPTHYNFVTWGIYLAAVLLGSGGSTVLITSLSITADLIGKNVEGGAFVYGLMSFADKVTNGVIIVLIQDGNTDADSYYRDIIFWACGGACVVGIIAAITMVNFTVSHRRGVARSIVSLMSNDDSSGSDTGSCTSPTALCTAPSIGDKGSISESHLKGINNPASDVWDDTTSAPNALHVPELRSSRRTSSVTFAV